MHAYNTKDSLCWSISGRRMLSSDQGCVWLLIASHRISLPLLILGGNLMFVFLPPGRVQSTERGCVGHHKPHSRREHWADCLRGAGWCYEASVRPAGCEGDQDCHGHSRCPHQHPQREWGEEHAHIGGQKNYRFIELNFFFLVVSLHVSHPLASMCCVVHITRVPL